MVNFSFLQKEDIKRLLDLTKSNEFKDNSEEVKYFIEKYPKSYILFSFFGDIYFSQNLFLDAFKIYTKIPEKERSVELIIKIIKCQLSLDKNEGFLKNVKEVENILKTYKNKYKNLYQFEINILQLLFYLKKGDTTKTTELIKKSLNLNKKKAKKMFILLFEQLVMPENKIEKDKKIELLKYLTDLG